MSPRTTFVNTFYRLFNKRIVGMTRLVLLLVMVIMTIKVPYILHYGFGFKLYYLIIIYTA